MNSSQGNKSLSSLWLMLMLMLMAYPHECYFFLLFPCFPIPVVGEGSLTYGIHKTRSLIQNTSLYSSAIGKAKRKRQHVAL